ncbi:DUF2157 domain-containing protein [Aquibacillus sediminis]|uniref:DUF2157 domain-containing protein n=1 Tax=Aquibacillus sediminis TaxID=2574734 RepID=UPI001485D5E9|nr:DUF2157 domain-containing protein [Aquibacillus sediminis]
MNSSSIKNEARKWKEKGIISEEQRQQIVALYQEKDHNFLLLSFAGLFVGLGFLTFIASNWSVIPDLGRMAIILLFMLVFYVTGDIIYRKKSHAVGITFIVMGLFVFGAGIFLTGQMYNYMSFQATPFFIWSIVGLLLFVIYQHVALYIVAITITTVGQLYSAFVYQEFHLLLFLVLLLGFGHYTYHQARNLYGTLAAVSFIIQTMVLVFVGEQSYYWLIVYFLLLYVLGDVADRKRLTQPLTGISLLAIFLFTVIQVFILSSSYIKEQLSFSWSFFGCWLVLFIISSSVKYWKNKKMQYVDLVLFLPIVYLPFADMVYMLSLFLFSLGYLLIGYKEENQAMITVGTITFLISTLIAYVHLAWDFLDKSLFFFVGGILLFLLSFLLERKRRLVKKEAKGGEK